MTEQKDFIVAPFTEIESRFGLNIQDYSSDLFLSNNPTDEAVYEDPKMNIFTRKILFLNLSTIPSTTNSIYRIRPIKKF